MVNAARPMRIPKDDIARFPVGIVWKRPRMAAEKDDQIAATAMVYIRVGPGQRIKAAMRRNVVIHLFLQRNPGGAVGAKYDIRTNPYLRRRFAPGKVVGPVNNPGLFLFLQIRDNRLLKRRKRE